LAFSSSRICGERPWRPFKIFTSLLASAGAASGLAAEAGAASEAATARCWRTLSSLGLKRDSSLWKVTTL
jgi:hypothetical protein